MEKMIHPFARVLVLHPRILWGATLIEKDGGSIDLSQIFYSLTVARQNDLTDSPPTHKHREHKKDRPRLSKNNLREDYRRQGGSVKLFPSLRPPGHLLNFLGLNEIRVVKLAS
jgi:hypothetical protein